MSFRIVHNALSPTVLLTVNPTGDNFAKPVSHSQYQLHPHPVQLQVPEYSTPQHTISQQQISTPVVTYYQNNDSFITPQYDDYPLILSLIHI
jgi:hypothetical protein